MFTLVNLLSSPSNTHTSRKMCTAPLHSSCYRRVCTAHSQNTAEKHLIAYTFERSSPYCSPHEHNAENWCINSASQHIRFTNSLRSTVTSNKGAVKKSPIIWNWIPLCAIAALFGYAVLIVWLVAWACVGRGYSVCIHIPHITFSGLRLSSALQLHGHGYLQWLYRTSPTIDVRQCQWRTVNT